MAVTAGLSVDIRRKRFAGDGRTPPHTAIENLQFDVPVGQFCCLLGPSGCGKTTLLNIAAGLDHDVDGSVGLPSDDTGSRPAVSYMFQTPRLLPWMSVRDNVDIVLDPGARAEGHGVRLLERMELRSYLDAYPTRPAGGRARRGRVPRALGSPT
ncbi:MAG: ATP-binding cassette domain-containing protein, partial [Rhodospirillales bacterium]|nr:ATP-binding cassette domain-containing protein [Rhodospirillales bacterium]